MWRGKHHRNDDEHRKYDKQYPVPPDFGRGIVFGDFLLLFFIF
jgi:hypothetical protein